MKLMRAISHSLQLPLSKNVSLNRALILDNNAIEFLYRLEIGHNVSRCHAENEYSETWPELAENV